MGGETTIVSSITCMLINLCGTDIFGNALYFAQERTELKGEPFWGYLATYSGGGYIANIGNTASEAYQVISDLESSGTCSTYLKTKLISLLTY